jgi:hypothetical protein
MKAVAILLLLIPASIGFEPRWCYVTHRVLTSVRCYGMIVERCEWNGETRYERSAGWLPRSKCEAKR